MPLPFLLTAVYLKSGIVLSPNWLSFRIRRSGMTHD